jgi:putative Mg2+ transporter-C (MgtC) family protein
MGTLWTAISGDLDTLRTDAQFWQAVFRLVVAALLGGVLGYQRERAHQAAGLRTHMLVTMGAALFVLMIQHAGGTSADFSRVAQGVVTGIGFIGAGAIIKLDKEHEVHGLTTAAGIWLATAIGMATGLGRLELALPGTLLAFIVLAVLRKLEPRVGLPDRHPAEGR